MRYAAGQSAFVASRWAPWLGDALLDARLTRTGLAQRVGLASSRVTEWLNGDRVPSAYMAYRVGAALSSELPWVSEVAALYAAGWVGDLVGVLADLVLQENGGLHRAGMFIIYLPRLEALDWAIRDWPKTAAHLTIAMTKQRLSRLRSFERHEVKQAIYGDGLSSPMLSHKDARLHYEELWRRWDHRREALGAWYPQFKAALEITRIRGTSPQFAMRGAWEQLRGWIRAGFSIGGPPLSVDSDEYELYQRAYIVKALAIRKTTNVGTTKRPITKEAKS